MTRVSIRVYRPLSYCLCSTEYIHRKAFEIGYWLYNSKCKINQDVIICLLSLLSNKVFFFSTAPCTGSTFFCHSNMCINNSLVCNGIQNCAYPWDENHCKGESAGEGQPLEVWPLPFTKKKISFSTTVLGITALAEWRHVK